jgi:HSP20 family protein
MTLLKKSDYRPLFPSVLDNLFSRDLMDWTNSNYSLTNTTLPAVNIKETEDEYQIEVAAPGMSKKDFKVSLDNNQLTISSEKKEEKEENEDKYSRREFSYQSFQRSFSLQQGLVDSDKISAKYNDGVLYITLPKREEMKPKPAKEIQIA